MDKKTVYLTEGLEAFCDAKDRALAASTDTHEFGHELGWHVRWGEFSAAWHGLDGSEVRLRQSGLELRLGSVTVLPCCTLEIYHESARSKKRLLQPRYDLHTYVFARVGNLMTAVFQQEHLPKQTDQPPVSLAPTLSPITIHDAEIISRELDRGATGRYAMYNRPSRFAAKLGNQSTSILSWK